MADMVNALDLRDEIHGDNGVDTSTGDDWTVEDDKRNGVIPSNDGDRTADDDEQDGVNPSTDGNGTANDDEQDGVDPSNDGDGTMDGLNCADEIDTTDNCSIEGGMLSGVELSS